MRVWASCNTLTFEEVAPNLGAKMLLRFSMVAQYIGPLKASSGHWPIGIELESEVIPLINVPELGRRSYLVNGYLKKTEFAYVFDSVIEMAVAGGTKSPWLNEIHGKHKGELLTALIELDLYGSECAPCSRAHEVIVHRFESLDLRHGSSTFRQWNPALSYADLVANPDIAGGGLLLAEVEVLSKIGSNTDRD